MKKFKQIILMTMLICILFASCSKTTSRKNTYASEKAENLFMTVIEADEALSEAKKADIVLIKDDVCISGKELMENFFNNSIAKTPSSVICAFYYTLDKETTDSELYEQEKDNYPKLYFYKTVYDGEKYYLICRQSNKELPEEEKEFKYLSHTTENIRGSKYCEIYFLTNDKDVSWSEIFQSLISSNSNTEIIDYCSVYYNFYLKEEAPVC